MSGPSSSPDDCQSEECTNLPVGETGHCLPCLRFAFAMLLGVDADFADRMADHDSGPVDITLALIDERGVTVASTRTVLRLDEEVYGGTFTRNPSPTTNATTDPEEG